MDLRGQVYGELTVLEDTGKRFHRSVVWLCRCSCGKECEVPATYLRSGGKTRCDDCKGPRAKGPRAKGPRAKGPYPGKDLTGRRFGELEVLGPTEERDKFNIIWECRCSCGKIVCYPTRSLVNGFVKSCGHLHKLDICGMKFGRLTAIRPIEYKMGSSTSVSWLCYCDCGGARIVPANLLAKGVITSCGCARKSKKNGGIRITCPDCKNFYFVDNLDEPVPQFCSDCSPKYLGNKYKVCPICKRIFFSPNPESIVCSEKCSEEWEVILRIGVPKRRWSGTSQKAITWILVAPSGEEIIVENLPKWAEKNTELFGKPPGKRSADQISAGFRGVKAVLLGKRGGARHYKGWTLRISDDPPK